LGAMSVIAFCRRHFLLVTQCSPPLDCLLTLPIWWSTLCGWSAGSDARRANRDGAEDEGRLMAGSVAPKLVKLNPIMVSDWREVPSRRPTAAKPDLRRGSTVSDAQLMERTSGLALRRTSQRPQAGGYFGTSPEKTPPPPTIEGCGGRALCRQLGFRLGGLSGLVPSFPRRVSFQEPGMIDHFSRHKEHP
jgi:hypothetical protein